MSFRLTKAFTFEAAHALPYVAEDHPCRRMHGHSYRVEIHVEGEVDPTMGWVYDYQEINAAMQPLLNQLDHAYLNDLPGLENPTSENLAAWLWQQLAPQCRGLREIVIQETSRARCSYRGT